MRITNVEKFRNELYEAIRDTCEWRVDTPSVIFKNEFEYKETMKDYTHFEMIDGTPHAISLPAPLEIGGGKLYLTVGTEEVAFWKSEKEYFKFDGYIDFKLYKNKLSFIAALVLRIANKLVNEEEF